MLSTKRLKRLISILESSLGVWKSASEGAWTMNGRAATDDPPHILHAAGAVTVIDAIQPYRLPTTQWPVRTPNKARGVTCLVSRTPWTAAGLHVAPNDLATLYFMVFAQRSLIWLNAHLSRSRSYEVRGARDCLYIGALPQGLPILPAHRPCSLRICAPLYCYFSILEIVSPILLNGWNNIPNLYLLIRNIPRSFRLK